MRIHPVLAFFLQTIVAGIVLVPTALWVFINTGTFEGGLQSVFWLLYACIVSVFTITVVAVVGLPLRLVKRLRAGWQRLAPLVWVAAVLGFAAVIVSFHPSLITTEQVEIDGVSYTAVTPLWWMTLTGWFVLAFSLVHLVNPFRRRVPRVDPAPAAP